MSNAGPDTGGPAATGDGPGADASGSWLGRQLRRPVVEPTHVLAPVLMLVTLWALSEPGWNLIWTRLCLVGWFIVAALCVGGLVQRLVHDRRGQGDERSLWMFMVMPICALFVVTAAITEAPVKVRFEFAKSEMTAQAQQYLTDPRTAGFDHIGPFAIDRVNRERGAVFYVTGNGGSDDEYGLVFSPATPPEGSNTDRFVQLDGAWYLWYSNSQRRLFV